jgi:hypothetical protein
MKQAQDLKKTLFQLDGQKYGAYKRINLSGIPTISLSMINLILDGGAYGSTCI